MLRYHVIAGAAFHNQIQGKGYQREFIVFAGSLQENDFLADPIH